MNVKLKKIVLVLLTVTLLLSLNVFATNENIELNLESWGGDVATGFAGGDGSMQNPYQISTAQQLAYMATVVNSDDSSVREQYRSAHYILTDNINISGKNWVPIGVDEYERGFIGHFDGNDKTITGLTIGDVTDNKPVGLFSFINEGAMVRDLKLADVMINTASSKVGAVAGKAEMGYEGSETAVYNVDVLGGSITGKSNGVRFNSGVGGLIGAGNITIYHSTNAATVSNNVSAGSVGYLQVGGIIGYQGTVVGCVNTGDITVNSMADVKGGNIYVGGIVGTNGVVYNTVNKGNITVDESAATVESTLLIGGIGASTDAYNTINEGNIQLVELSEIPSRYTSYIAGISASSNATYEKYNCVNTGTYTASSGTYVKYDTIGHTSVYNSYWSDSLSHGNTSSSNQAIYYSGTFAADGTLTTASNSVGDVPYSDILTALNDWAESSEALHIATPIHWNYTEASGFSFVSATDDVTIDVVDGAENPVSNAVIELKTFGGSLLYSHSGSAATYQSLEMGRYVVEVSAEGMLKQRYMWNNVDGSDLTIRLIGVTAPATAPNGDIIIDSIENLAYISQQVNDKIESYEGKTLVLNRDLDLSGYNWTPIGYIKHDYSGDSSEMSPFMGVFDGNDKSITGISVSALNDTAGLFGFTRAADIKSLTINSPNIMGFSSYAGALVGVAWNENSSSADTASIQNVTVNDATILTGTRGRNDTIYPSVGGIVGILYGGDVVNCIVSSGSIVNYTGHDIGGIVGTVSDNTTYYDSVVDGSFSMTNVLNNATITSNGSAGGILGASSPVDEGNNTIESAINSGNIASSSSAGGIVGYAGGTIATTIKNSTNNGEVSTPSHEGMMSATIGGIIGYDNSESIVDRCNNNGTIIINNNATAAGGIVGGGYAFGNITNCSNLGEIFGSTTNNGNLTVGGIVGEVRVGDKASIVANNYNIGTISISAGVDGNDSSAGGIIGTCTFTNNDEVFKVMNNYNLATVFVPDGYGSGIIDIAGYNIDVSYNYSKEIAGQPIVGYTLAYDTEDMPTVKSNATFANNLGRLTAATGVIDNNGNSSTLDISYTGEPIALSLIDALNGFIGDETLSNIQGLIGWTETMSINAGYPVIPSPPNYDINNDFKINVEDIKTIVNPLNYNKPTSAAVNSAADVNKDGVINFLDAAATRNSSVFEMD